jgi:hypothetical protein
MYESATMLENMSEFGTAATMQSTLCYASGHGARQAAMGVRT